MNDSVTSDIDAIIINSNDNIAVCLRDIEDPGEIRVMKEGVIVPLQVKAAVPLGHKIAVCDIAEGEEVLKYAEVIGRMTAPVRVGEHVHTHNMSD